MFQLIGSMEELQQCRVQQRNIATTIDKLTHCLPGNAAKQARGARIRVLASYLADALDF